MAPLVGFTWGWLIICASSCFMHRNVPVRFRAIVASHLPGYQVANRHEFSLPADTDTALLAQAQCLTASTQQAINTHALGEGDKRIQQQRYQEGTRKIIKIDFPGSRDDAGPQQTTNQAMSSGDGKPQTSGDQHRCAGANPTAMRK